MTPRQRAPIVHGFAIAWSMLVELFHRVLAEPFHNGRLRAKAWPVGLRAIVTLAIFGYALAVGGIVFSSHLRESLDLSVTVGSATLSFPRPLLWIPLVLTVLAIALLQTAALHVSGWLAATITFLVVLILQFASGPDNSSVLSPGRIATIVAAIGLIVFTIVRRRYRFVWWEFVVILPTIGIAVAIAWDRAASVSLPTGVDFGPTTLSLTMFTIGQLAVPAAIAAGAAVAALSTSTALWAVGVVRRRLPSVALVIGLVIVIFWRIWVFVAAFNDPERFTAIQLVSSVILIAAVAALWYVLARVRGRRVLVPSASRLVDRMGTVSTPIAAALAGTLAPLVVALLIMQIVYAYGAPLESFVWLHWLVGFLSTSSVLSVVRLIVGAALITLGIILARRGIRTIPELISGIGMVTATTAVVSLFGLSPLLWTGDALTAAATIACFGLLAWFGVRKTLTMNRVTGLIVVLLIAALFDQRDFVSDPLGAVLGFTGVAFVLFGFVWSFLIGGRTANGQSAKYPRPSRVLLFLANSVFGVTVLAFTALARDPDAAIDLGAFALVGDELLGTGLLVCVLLSVLSAVVENRVPPIESVGTKPPASDANREPVQVPATREHEGAIREAADAALPPR